MVLQQVSELGLRCSVMAYVSAVLRQEPALLGKAMFSDGGKDIREGGFRVAEMVYQALFHPVYPGCVVKQRRVEYRPAGWAGMSGDGDAGVFGAHCTVVKSRGRWSVGGGGNGGGGGGREGGWVVEDHPG